MKLKEILDMPAGTLIKGIRWVQKENDSFVEQYAAREYLGHHLLNPNGWDMITRDGEHRIFKPSSPHRTIALTVMLESDILEPEKEALIKDISDITSNKMHINTGMLRNMYLRRQPLDPLREGELVGMSLGENLVGFVQESSQLYQRDWYRLMCWHKILIRDKVCWIRLYSLGTVNANSRLGKTAAEVTMELL